MDLSKYISDLLFNYDCVIVPGFGGFIGNYSPARIQATRNAFFPPFKSLLFNPNLKQNDGLLAVRISLAENTSYEDALLSIRSAVNQWQRQLALGVPVTIDSVGRLIRDREGNIRFSPSEETNFLPESYGLEPFIFPVVNRTATVEKAAEKTIQGAQPVETNPYLIPKVLKWAALLALPLGTAALLGVSNLEKIRSLSVAYSGILFSSPAGSESPVRTPSKPTYLAKPVTPKPAAVQKETVKPELKQARAVSEKPFIIIVGAFRFLENAESLVTGLKAKGYEATMAGQTKTGLYRVSLHSFTDKNEAVQQLTMVRNGGFPSAWLLVK